MKISTEPYYGHGYKTMLYRTLCKEHGVKLSHIGNSIMSKWPCVDIIHLHHPENITKSGGVLRRLYKVVLYMSRVTHAKWRGARLVWTVHNLQSHKKSQDVIDKLFKRLFLNQVDGVIHLSEVGKAMAMSSMPRLKVIKYHAVIQHGLFNDLYGKQVPKEEACRVLGLSNDQRVLMFGNVEWYKGYDEVLRDFMEYDVGIKVLIAGRIKGAELQNQILRYTEEDDRITVIDRYIEDHEVPVILSASDVVIMPYREGLNSGILALGITYNKIVVSRSNPVFSELVDALSYDAYYEVRDGRYWDEVIRHIADVRPRKTIVSRKLSWEKIASKTMQFYRRVADQAVS